MASDRRALLLPLLLLGFIGLAVVGLGGFILWELRPLPSPQPAAALPASTPTAPAAGEPTVPLVLAAAPTLLAPATVAPTLAPAPLPDIVEIELDSDQQAQVDRVLQDVLDLRDISPQAPIRLRLVAGETLIEIARARFLDEAARAHLAREARALAALGLLPPDYDLAGAALNRRLHPSGGLYLPETREVYLAGVRFGALERRLSADLFDRALLEDKFALRQPLADPGCQANPEPCRALGALAAGDAALAAEMWTEKFASPGDRRDIALYRQPALAAPQPGAPPFLVEDASFEALRGLRFARFLYAQNRWLGLDRVYRDPPRTSEQILHPRKYSEGELPAAVEAPAGLPGEGWQTDWSSTLGEWYTLLLLSVPADAPARLERDLAAAAAAGWNGDAYQVYYHPARNQAALAARWQWDTETDADEFANALMQQANARYPAGRLPGSALKEGACWQNAVQISCILVRPTAVLWLLAPDAQTLKGLRGLYPDG